MSRPTVTLELNLDRIISVEPYADPGPVVDVWLDRPMTVYIVADGASTPQTIIRLPMYGSLNGYKYLCIRRDGIE